MVAFVDPRKSKIDIAQAAGRAMRQSKATNKKLGYIVVPLFIEQKKGETEAEAFTRAGFDEVAEVLGAMLESDDDLVDTIKEMQEARGRGDKFNPRRLHEKIEVIGPAINLDKLTQSIDVEILERLGVSWDRWFAMLQDFKKLNGHCRVPQLLSVSGHHLGNWVHNQRHGKTKLSEEQIQRLESVGFSWDPLAEKWEEGYRLLERFARREKHCRVNLNHVESDFKLGSWVNSCRQKRNILKEDQIRRLDSLGFSWRPIVETWEKAYESLLEFTKRKGHCRVPPRLTTNGIRLGSWLRTQRANKERLSPEQVSKLNSAGISWDPHAEQWEVAYELLKKFVLREGHCRVVRTYITNGFKLGVWVFQQRQRKVRLTADKIGKLDSLGFSWDPFSEQWDIAFKSLQDFYEREGHTLVNFKHVENGVNLGTWVSDQRKKKLRLTNDQLRRLQRINFSWDPRADRWEAAFDAFKKHREKCGHSRILKKCIVNGIDIGAWAASVRQKREQLTQNQLKRLNSLEFCWSPHAEQWEKAFSALQQFHRKNGHCVVPKSYETNGLKLGAWVSKLRQRKQNLTKNYIKRLNSIGFTW
jgi:hypothetical protein